MSIKINKSEIFLLGLLSLLYFSLTVTNIKFAEFGPDEFQMGNYAFNVLNNENLVFHTDCTFLNTKIPVTFLGSYLFTLPNMILLVPFCLFGAKLIVLKYFSVFWIWLTLMVFYFVIKKIFNKEISQITAALLVLSPVFIKYSTYAIWAHELFCILLFWSGILFYLFYEAHQKKRYLFAAAFFIGTGFSVKLTYLFLLLSFIAASILVYPGRFRELLKTTRIHKLGFILFFSLGSIFFLYHNITAKAPSFRFAITGIRQNRIESPTGSRGVLKGSADNLIRFISEDSDPKKYISVLIISVLGNLLLYKFKITGLFRRKYVFMLIFFFFLAVHLVLLSALYTKVWAQYYTMLFPFPQLFMALFMYNIINNRFIKLKNIGYFAASGLFFAIVYSNSSLLVSYQRQLISDNMQVMNITAIDQLKEYINNENIGPLLVNSEWLEGILVFGGFSNENIIAIYGRADNRNAMFGSEEQNRIRDILDKYGEFFYAWFPGDWDSLGRTYNMTDDMKKMPEVSIVSEKIFYTAGDDSRKFSLYRIEKKI